MAKLILDTSTWIDIAKPKFEDILCELENQVEEGITVLLTCNIIKDEWERNKRKIISEIASSIKSHAKSAIKISELLDEEESKNLLEILEKYSKLEDKQIELAEKYFNRVEILMSKSESYAITNDLKIEMADKALTKKAPFHNSKNNMADGLLYYGAVQYVIENNQIATDLIFVTSNIKEFADPQDVSKLHPELSEKNIHFFNNLAAALKMRKEEIDLMDDI